MKKLFRVSNMDFYSLIRIDIAYKDDNGTTYMAKPVDYVKITDTTFRSESMLEFTYDETVMLLDELLRSGVKPSDQGSTGQLNAVKAHLEDMRSLVFKLNK